MEIRRDVLNKLRECKFLVLAEELGPKITNSDIFREELQTEVSELTNRLDTIISLGKAFIAEMRENAYTVEGTRRTAYASDCWELLYDWQAGRHELSEWRNFALTHESVSTDEKGLLTLFAYKSDHLKYYDIFTAARQYFSDVTSPQWVEDMETEEALNNWLAESKNDRMATASEPVEPGAKLQWNGTNDSLYDLIAQLSQTNISATKPLLGNTIEGLAKFLSEHVEGMPSVETIERRLRTFREQNAQPPKRGRIELYINKDKP